MGSRPTQYFGAQRSLVESLPEKLDDLFMGGKMVFLTLTESEEVKKDRIIAGKNC